MPILDLMKYSPLIIDVLDIRGAIYTVILHYVCPPP